MHPFLVSFVISVEAGERENVLATLKLGCSAFVAPGEFGEIQLDIWIAAVAAAGLAVLSGRMVAYAFSSSLGQPPRQLSVGRLIPTVSTSQHDSLNARQIWMMAVEIAFSIGIATVILGLSFAASMPAHLMAAALLAQVAVVGTLIAPPVIVNLGQFSLRPAALALGIAQLAQVAFFVRTLESLLS